MPASARADVSTPPLTVPQTIVRDCTQDSVIDGKYSQADLQAALDSLVGDTAEYGECESLLESALGISVTKKKPRHDSGGGEKRNRPGATAPPTLISKQKRTQIDAQVKKEAKLDPKVSAPKLSGLSGLPLVRPNGTSQQSAQAPGIPTSLLIALSGMLLMFGSDLAARASKNPRFAAGMIAIRRRIGRG